MSDEKEEWETADDGLEEWEVYDQQEQAAQAAAGDLADDSSLGDDVVDDGADEEPSAVTESEMPVSDVESAAEETSAAALTGSAIAGAKIAPLNELSEANSESLGLKQDLDVILDIPVKISMEVGSTELSIRNLIQLTQGSVIELDRLAGEPLDVMVNGTLIAQGEVVVVNEKFGIRITDVVSPSERLKKLR